MRPIMKEADFRRQLKAPCGGAYLLFGDEDYLKAYAVRMARQVICDDPSFAVFNDVRLDAMDFTPDKLQGALMPPPMMADYKIVTLCGLDFANLKPSEVEGLCQVLEEADQYPYNLLIVSIPAGGMDVGYLPKKPSALFSRLSECMTPVQFERTTPQKLQSWIGRHLEHNGVGADDGVCRAIMETCGHDMFTLAGETDKLSWYVLAHGRKTATVEDVRTVCCSVTEYDAFAFANAVMEGRREEALAILSQLMFRRTDPIVILGEITRVFCDLLAVKAMTADGAAVAEISRALNRMHEYKVGLYQRAAAAQSWERLRAAIALCGETDAALKSSFQSGYLPLERLICAL